MRSQTNKTMRVLDTYPDIRGDYLPRQDIFTNESLKVQRTKKALAKLSPSDQLIIIHYSEDRSLQKTANRFGVSKAYIHKVIKRIRDDINRVL